MGVVSGLTRLVGDKKHRYDKFAQFTATGQPRGTANSYRACKCVPRQGVGGPPRRRAHSLWKRSSRANAQVAANADGGSVFPEWQC